MGNSGTGSEFKNLAVLSNKRFLSRTKTMYIGFVIYATILLQSTLRLL